MSKPLIETISFKLKGGVSTEQFLTKIKQMQERFVSKQAGFISRETSVSEDGMWFINVHWQSKADSDNSIAAFDSAPGKAVQRDAAIAGWIREALTTLWHYAGTCMKGQNAMSHVCR